MQTSKAPCAITLLSSALYIRHTSRGSLGSWTKQQEAFARSFRPFLTVHHFAYHLSYVNGNQPLHFWNCAKFIWNFQTEGTESRIVFFLQDFILIIPVSFTARVTLHGTDEKKIFQFLDPKLASPEFLNCQSSSWPFVARGCQWWMLCTKYRRGERVVPLDRPGGCGSTDKVALHF